MGDMGDDFRAWNEHKKQLRDRNLENAFAHGTNGWTVHTPFHWSRILLGDQLHYWPSKRKLRWRDRNFTLGSPDEVENFIRNREQEDAT